MKIRNQKRNQIGQVIGKMPIMICTMLVLLGIAIMSATSVDALARPRLVISGFEVVNGSATVGNNFVLQIDVTNIDVVCAMSTTVGISANSPFVATTSSNAAPVDICGGQTKTVSIPMHIDSTATGGSYQIPVSLSFEDTLNTPYSSSDSITLFVSGSPQIQAHISNSNPIDVYPGDTATITVALQNAGTFEAQSLNASLSADSANLLNNPLEIKWANSFAYVGTLAARQTTNTQFSVELPKDAQPQNYPMVLTVQYLDENRALQTQKIQLTFTAKQKALFSATAIEGQTMYANDNQKTFHVMIKNTGTDTAYKLQIKAQPQYPFTTDGSVRYVDSLAPGASAPVDLVFSADKDGTIGAYGLDLLVNFEDAQGKSLHDTANLQISISQKGILRAVFADYWYLWVVAIIICFFVYRKRVKSNAAKAAAKVAAKK